MIESGAISFADPEVRRCPFAAYAKLQAEHPVYVDPGTGFFVVTRYADIAYVNSHPELFSNTTTQITDRRHSPVAAEVAQRLSERGFLPMHTLVSNDPPSHTQYRALVDKAFSRSTVASMTPAIRSLVSELIDDIADKKRIDFFAEFAIKLPMYVISGELGLPREDWRRFKQWSDAALALIDPTLSPERELELTEVVIEMQQYLHRAAVEYRKNPAPKLLSHVANAEIDGRRLSDQELISIATQLLVAGNETTTTTLAIAVFMLIEQPELRQRLAAEVELIPAYVEEVLRLHAPVPHFFRRVVRDTELCGVALPAESTLFLVYGAGNRDPEKFPAPERVDLERKNHRSHMSFGTGIHYCIGHLLARTELQIALEEWLTRVPNFELDPSKPAPRWSSSFQAHCLESLDLVIACNDKT